MKRISSKFIILVCAAAMCLSIVCLSDEPNNNKVQNVSGNYCSIVNDKAKAIMENTQHRKVTRRECVKADESASILIAIFILTFCWLVYHD